MKQEKEQTTFRLPVGMVEFMQKYGEKHGVSLTNVIREIVEFGYHRAHLPNFQYDEE